MRQAELCIATSVENARICRGQGRAPRVRPDLGNVMWPVGSGELCQPDGVSGTFSPGAKCPHRAASWFCAGRHHRAQGVPARGCREREPGRDATDARSHWPGPAWVAPGGVWRGPAGKPIHPSNAGTRSGVLGHERHAHRRHGRRPAGPGRRDGLWHLEPAGALQLRTGPGYGVRRCLAPAGPGAGQQPAGSGPPPASRPATGR